MASRCASGGRGRARRAPSQDVKVALIGAGVQGVSHLEVLAAVTEGAALTICARHLERAEELAAQARATGRFSAIETTQDPVAAATGADVVLTMVSFGAQRQLVPTIALSAASLIIAVDYDMCIPAQTARSSSLFLTDDVAQLLATRAGDVFADYPDPDGSIGQALLGRGPTRDPRDRSSWTILEWALRMSSLPTRSFETPPNAASAPS